MSSKSTIFIASGGTGGHIIPARCLGKELANRGFEVVFLGDKNYQNYIKEDDKFLNKIISSSKLEKSFFKLFRAAFAIGLGVLQSLILFLVFSPKYIVAFGGYSTFPSLIAAVILRKKIILHEQNAHLGKVNRFFIKYANKVALSFPVTSGIAATFNKKTVFVGNPVREEILALNHETYSLPQYKQEEEQEKKQEKELPSNRMGYDVLLASDFYDEEKEQQNRENHFNILIIGGSGGARIFSEILPKAFFNLGEHVKERIHVTQQCRKELIDSTFAQYRSFNINITMDYFFEDMPELIKAAHLVIARAGSSSIFEFCAAKKPMILVPFALSADNHQEKNAKYLEEKGAAIVLRENEFTINKINELLKKLIDNKKILEEMSGNCSALATLDATKKLADLII